MLPFDPRITVTGDRIDLQADDRYPPNTPCGDQPTGWCFRESTGPLPGGVYRIFTTILPAQPVERSPVVVQCPQRTFCTPAPLGNKPDGVNGPAFTMTTWDPDGSGPRPELLVVSGIFLQAGGVDASNIAAWDGVSWSHLGGIDNFFVDALTEFRGELIAAGMFTNAGGTPVVNIARWDGVQWRPLGAGIGTPSNSQVFGLTVFRDELIAVGYFAVAGGVPASRIARWDGLEWRPLGAGIGEAQRYDPVYTATVFNDQLVVAGTFRTAGGMPARNLARWDGTDWHPMDAGTESWRAVNTLLTHEGSLFAGTTACPASGCTGSVLEWDGSAWRPRDAGLPGRPIGTLTSFQGQLLAATGHVWLGNWSCLTERVLQWDGTRWTSIAHSEGPMFALGVYHDELIVAGQFSNVDLIPANNVARLACTLPACPADFNASGSVTSDDFFDFLTAFLNQDPGSDFNRDFLINSQDFFDFLAAFFAGC